MPYDHLDISVGTLLKVISVDAATGAVLLRLQDGRTATVTGLDPVPAPGAVFLFGEPDQLTLVPAETWPEANDVGVVRRVLENGVLIVDSGDRQWVVQPHLTARFAPGNTIAFNRLDGPVRLLTEDPVRRLRDRTDDEDDEPEREMLAPVVPEPLTFDDFGGFPDVVAQARELIESQFRYRKWLDRIGARPVRGVLFSGPPGVGKTHLARIIANETRAAFHVVDGPALVSKWVGQSERTLRSIFARAAAAETGRAIIFFDELDSIAERRTDHSHEAARRLVGQLLTLMDGFRRDASIIIIGATNRFDSLDPAILRPGRFDRHVAFGSPQASDRLAILKVGARRLNIRGDLPFRDIATLTEGWSAADLALIWTEASTVASRDRRGGISPEDMVLGFERAEHAVHASRQRQT